MTDLTNKAAEVRQTLKPLASITASAARLTRARLPDSAGRRTSRPAAESWQEEAWNTLDMVGEMHFLLSTLANRIATGSLYVGEIEPGEPSSEPVQTTKANVQDLLAKFGGNQAGRTQIIRRMAMNLLVAGEGWFFGTDEDLIDLALAGTEPGWWETASMPARLPTGTPKDPSECSWRTLSVSEIKSPRNDGTVDITLEDGSKINVTIDDAHLIRVWRPHDREAWKADSPMHAALPVLRILIGLTMRLAAEIDSRLAGAGLLAVKEGVIRAFKIAKGLPPDDDSNPLMEALLDAMTVPIQDRESAAAVVPLVTSYPDDLDNAFEHIKFWSDLDAELGDNTDRAIRRFALSQDAPPEILLGGGGLNHWGLWLTNEETVTVHVEPWLALICDALTTQFLWPSLIQSGMSPEEAERYVVWYSVEHMVARPNQFDEAKALYEAGEIDGDSYRRAGGFEVSDAPGEGETAVPGTMSEDEAKLKAVQTALALATDSPSLASTPGIPKLVEQLTAVYSGQEYVPDIPPALAEGVAEGGDDEGVPGELPTGPTTDGPSSVGDPSTA